MIKAHLTATGPVAADHIISGPVRRALIQVNTSLTGTLTVSDETATASTPVVAIITNPTVGQQYEYWGFTNGLTVVPNATCDITVSADLARSGV